jgi:hypothetical protein
MEPFEYLNEVLKRVEDVMFKPVLKPTIPKAHFYIVDDDRFQCKLCGGKQDLQRVCRECGGVS